MYRINARLLHRGIAIKAITPAVSTPRGTVCQIIRPLTVPTSAMNSVHSPDSIQTREAHGMRNERTSREEMV